MTLGSIIGNGSRNGRHRCLLIGLLVAGPLHGALAVSPESVPVPVTSAPMPAETSSPIPTVNYPSLDPGQVKLPPPAAGGQTIWIVEDGTRLPYTYNGAVWGYWDVNRHFHRASPVVAGAIEARLRIGSNVNSLGGPALTHPVRRFAAGLPNPGPRFIVQSSTASAGGGPRHR
jgi:hypothetical protein